MAAAYGNSLRGPLLFDDFGSIAQNESIRHIWPVWAAFHPPPGQTVSGRPLTNFSFAVSYALSGADPWGHHLLNVGIHASAALLLWAFLRRALRLPRLRTHFGAAADFLATTIAGLWAAHPLNTEAVTYLVQRAESLMGLLYLGVFYCFVRSLERPAWRAAAFLCCAAGMATKEVMVSAPTMLLLFDRIFVTGSWRALARTRGWFHACLQLPAVWLVLRVLQHGGRDPTSGFHVEGVAWSDYVATQFAAVARYLRLAFWPHPLNFNYAPFWVHSWREVALPALVCAGLIAGTAAAVRRAPAVAFAGILFFAILAPTSLVAGASQMIAEHRMYLALIPITTLTVLGAYRVAGRFPRLLAGGVAGIAIALTAATAARNQTYRTALALWTDTVAQDPRNGYARNILGTELQLAGRNDEALAAYDAAAAAEPSYADPPANAGEVLLQQGRWKEAEGMLRTAIHLAPRHAAAWEHLGTVLAAQGRPEDAEAALRHSVELAPGDPSFRTAYGNFLLARGDAASALEQYRSAVAAAPGRGDLHYNLGNALVRAGQLSAAEPELLAAVRSDSSAPEYANNLATLYAREGKFSAALPWFERALALRPSYWQARYNYALTLRQLGREREAAAELEAARRAAR